MSNCGPTRIDPIGGLLEYVRTIKPYHTKILESTVEYVQVEPVSVYIAERLFIDIYMTEPQSTQQFDCYGGYGIVWDDISFTTQYDVLDIDNKHYRMILEGDHLDVMLPGTKIKLFNSAAQNNGCYNVYSASYDGANTTIQLMQPIAERKPIGQQYYGYVTLATVGYSDDNYCYPICQDPLDVHAFIIESLKFSWGPEFGNSVTFNDPLVVAIDEIAQAVVATSDGQPLLPSSLDGPALDMATLDENLDTIVALYNQSM